MKDTGISDRLREDAGGIWEQIFTHPFVIELYGGSLPLEKFRFYALQDYNYLVTDIKNLAILASRAGSVGAMKEILEIAHLEATSEFQSYERLLSELGYTIEDAIKTEPTAVNTSYGAFLIATSSLATFGEGLAATLPCLWSYQEIAERHRDKLAGNKNDLYTRWASVYLSADYRQLVEKMKSLLDEAIGVDYGKLREAFITASRYEYLYWDMAYGTMGWQIPSAPA
jgi:thiaminase/transcriptional activator TenA